MGDHGDGGGRRGCGSQWAEAKGAFFGLTDTRSFGVWGWHSLDLNAAGSRIPSFLPESPDMSNPQPLVTLSHCGQISSPSPTPFTAAWQRGIGEQNKGERNEIGVRGQANED